MSATEQDTKAARKSSSLLHLKSLFHELKVDDQEDADPVIGNLDTRTLRTHVRTRGYENVQEHGRRYYENKEGEYLLPIDEGEQERLDLQHHLFLLALDGNLHVAPIEDMEGGLHNVLDVGTGTGIWAIDFANAYPSVSVVGTDISRIQPENIPSNCRFAIEDAEDDWTFSQPFDYIHGRALVTCFRSHKTVFEHAFKALRSGGYLELQDCNFPLRFIDSSGDGTALESWSQRFMAGGAALGKDFTRVAKYKDLLEEVGFVDVMEIRTQFPIGTWAVGEKAKTLGSWMRQNMLDGLHAGSMVIMTRGLGMTTEEIEVNLANVRREVLSNKIHACLPVSIVSGRKP